MVISKLKNTNFIWKYISAFLLLAAVSIVFHKEIYQQSFEKGEVCDWLPAGDFMLSVEYDGAPENSAFSLTAHSLVTPENKQGMNLIVEELPAGAGTRQFAVCVPAEARDIYISSEYVTSWSLQSVKLINYDNYFLALLFSLLAVVSLLYGAFYYHQKHNVFLLLIGIGILASFPLFGQSFPYNPDILFHFARINGICEGMRTGQFPVRINPVQLSGYGYITGTMYPQLFLYFPAILKLFHVSAMLGMQLLIFAANLATPPLTYAAVRRICCNDRIAFMSAVFYTLNPYRLINFYSRGALGEGIAMVFLPLVLWGTYEILQGRKEKWWILTLGMTGVLSSHMLSLEIYALLVMGEMVIWIFSKKKNDILKRIVAMGKATLCTILLNLYFLGPFLIFARLGLKCFSAVFHDDLYTLDLVRAFEPFAKWGDAYEILGRPAFMSVTMGEVVLGGICLFAGFLLKDKDYGQNELIKRGKQYFVLGSLFFFVSLWIMPWEQLLSFKWLNNTLGALQFPWRALGVSVMLFSIVTAIAVSIWENMEQQIAHRYLWPILLCVLLLQCGGYFGDIAHSAELVGKMEAEQSNFTDDLYMCEEMLPDYCYTTNFTHISCDIEEHLSWLSALNTGPDVTCEEPKTILWSNYQKRGLNISANVSSEHDFSASLPLCSYPGYCVLVDGEETEPYSLYSFLTCDLTQGTHHIDVRWKTPLVFRICDMISFCCLSVIALFLWKKSRRFQHKMRTGN